MTLGMRQTAFAFLEDRPSSHPIKALRTNNVYLALKPPTSVANAIAARVAPCGAECFSSAKPVAPSRFHMSILGVGKYPDLPASIIAGIDKRLRGIRFAPIAMTFDRLSCFGGGAIVLRVVVAEAINGLRRLAIDSLSDFPWSRRNHRDAFEPHLTVFYSDKRFPERTIEPVCWTATEIVLIHNCRGHTVLGAWPLTAPANVYDLATTRKRPKDLFD